MRTEKKAEEFEDHPEDFQCLECKKKNTMENKSS